MPREQLAALSSHGAHQGIALEVGNFPYADVADILDRAGEGPALVVVLDHVTDDGNFGAIVRSAEVVGAAGDRWQLQDFCRCCHAPAYRTGSQYRPCAR